MLRTTEVNKGCTDDNKPDCQRGSQVEVETQHYGVKCTMNGTMQCAKPEKHPGGIQIYTIDLFGDKKIENKYIKKYRNLE